MPECIFGGAIMVRIWINIHLFTINFMHRSFILQHDLFH